MDAQAPPLSGLVALCALARFHQIAAEPAALAHQLGLAPSATVGIDDLLRAARHLGLKAKRSRSTPERLQHIPLPALALMRSTEAAPRLVVLAQCDGQRVLFQDQGATVRVHPELARQGSAATYKLLAHVPLRGMVRRRVLDLFAGMYAPRGGSLDLGAAALPTDDAAGATHAKGRLLERLILKYIN